MTDTSADDRIDRRTALKAGAALGLVAPLGALATAAQPPGPKPEGYTDRLSYAPGDEVKFHVSASGRCDLQITRIGAQPKVVLRKAFTATVQEVPTDASSKGGGLRAWGQCFARTLSEHAIYQSEMKPAGQRGCSERSRA